MTEYKPVALIATEFYLADLFSSIQRGETDDGNNLIFLELIILWNKLKNEINNLQQVLLSAPILLSPITINPIILNPPPIGLAVSLSANHINNETTRLYEIIKSLRIKIAKNYVNLGFNYESSLNYITLISHIIQNKYVIDLNKFNNIPMTSVNGSNKTLKVPNPIAFDFLWILAKKFINNHSEPAYIMEPYDESSMSELKNDSDVIFHKQIRIAKMLNIIDKLNTDDEYGLDMHNINVDNMKGLYDIIIQKKRMLMTDNLQPIPEPTITKEPPVSEAAIIDIGEYNNGTIVNSNINNNNNETTRKARANANKARATAKANKARANATAKAKAKAKANANKARANAKAKATAKAKPKATPNPKFRPELRPKK